MRPDPLDRRPESAPDGHVAALSRRVVVLVPYWDFFERSAGGDLRASRAALLDELRALLTDLGETFWIDSQAAGATAAASIATATPSAIVVLQTMAVPPAWTTVVLDALPDTPVVVVVAQGRAVGAEDFDHAAIVELGGAVGGAQLTNALVRRGRAFRLVTAPAVDGDSRARIAGEARAAHAAGRLRGARLLRVGRPPEGYECVDCDSAALAESVGVTLVDLPPERLRDAYLEVGATDADALGAEVDRTWDVDAAERGGRAFDRSMRLAVALERLGFEYAADGGALNCHVPEIRLGADPGVAPCFALGRQTSAGRPWTCTGDVVTALAMLTLKLLGAAAWYHEVEALDESSDEALLACSGEHDLALAPPDERPALHANPWWEGVCACFTPPPGPATLVGFTPAAGARSGFRFVVAEGEFGDRKLTATGTVNAAFRFGGRSVAEGWERWARAGATHHAAATSGHQADAVRAVAEHLDVDCIVI